MTIVKLQGPIVGISSNYQYESINLPFTKGDCTLLYTDGVLDYIYNQKNNVKNSLMSKYDVIKERLRQSVPSQSLEKICSSLILSKGETEFDAGITNDITAIALRKE